MKRVAEPRRFFPRRWYVCTAFCEDLYRRRYAEPDITAPDGVRRVLPDGLYWYLYELWQDGVMAEREAVLAGPLDADVISVRPARAEHPGVVVPSTPRDEDEEQ